RPLNVLRVVTNVQQQVEFLGKERVIVVEIEAEERKCLDERATAHYHLGTTARNKVKRGKALEQADWIIGAEHSSGAVQTDVFRARRGRREDHRWSRVEELAAMMLADAKGIEADLVGAFDLLQQVSHPLDRGHCQTGGRISNG